MEGEREESGYGEAAAGLSEAEWARKRKYPFPGTEAGCSGPTEAEEGLGLEQWVAWVEQQGMGGLSEEFTLLGLSDRELRPSEEDGLVCRRPENTGKNRHRDVLCLDEHRVELRDGLPGEYIHASFVDGFRRPKAYICTQAPLAHTRVDFWRMVWQEKVGTVVMLTRLHESTVKATPYWPMRETDKIRYGPFVVTNRRVGSRLNYVLTELTVHNLITDARRPCYHLYYMDWPDHCIPLYMKGFLHFMERVRQVNHFFTKRLEESEAAEEGTTPPAPVLVHCSAGIGRSGTFIALDIAFGQLVASRRLGLCPILRRMRRQRHGALQTVEQFLFAHLVLLYLLKEERLYDLSAVDPSHLLRNFPLST